MSELSDRILILIVAAVGIGGMFVAILGGLVEAELVGTPRTIVMVGLAGFVVAILVGLWFGFDRIEPEWS